MERVIGRERGEKQKPLLVLIGAMHGNEPAGVRAIELLLKMLEVEPITNPEFELNGNILGLIGNLEALKQKTRFIDRDMNRCWTVENASAKQITISEQREIQEVLALIQQEIKETQASSVVVMDLHTTSGIQGIFAIPSETADSLAIAKELHAPVILGMLAGLKGTSLHFFNEEHLGVPCTPIVFESGQHLEKLSVNRAIAAIVNCMRTIKMVKSEHVENVHDKILLDFIIGIPRVSKLVYSHPISSSDNFKMQPGYANFSKIAVGDWLATDIRGKIYSDFDGMLLMPLYQSKGEDGFFIISAV